MVLFIILSDCIASATKQRCVCQLCMSFKWLIMLSQIRLSHKKQTAAYGRRFTTNHFTCRQQRCIFWNVLFRIKAVAFGRLSPACWRSVSSAFTWTHSGGLANYPIICYCWSFASQPHNCVMRTERIKSSAAVRVNYPPHLLGPLHKPLHWTNQWVKHYDFDEVNCTGITTLNNLKVSSS